MFSIYIFNRRYQISLENICLVLILFITLSAGTALGYRYRPFAYNILGLVSIISIIATKKINLNSATKYYFIWLIFLLLNTYFSYSVTISTKFFRYYAFLFLLLISPISEKFWQNYLKPIRIVVIIVAISIGVSVINPGLFHSLFRLFLGGDSTNYLKRAAGGQYSGLAGEIAEAAVLMIYGIAIEWADVLTYGMKKKNLLLMALYFAGITLTTKRTLFVIAIAIPLAFFFLQDQKASTRIKSLGLIVLIVLIAIILLNTVPALNTMLERFTMLEEDESFGGRAGFWLFSFLMFQQSPITGLGYGSFNDYFNNNGGIFITRGTWNYYGHNIYLEALGEVGILGVIILFVPLIIVAFWGLFSFKKKEYEQYKNEIVIWTFFLIMYLLYGITGNCIYYPHQICMIVLSAYRLVTIRELVRKHS